ncbi:Rieske (2Fe-2S) protein [Emcibacter sp.]|uniref:Rieske (2Fe-2S) protein n=1 Tax=Emcibacter sp. TaxID=1979954 RepID=UPI002AA688B8|nr:Rieske (2Fe-2S) protein [Emcibacter sp.]
MPESYWTEAGKLADLEQAGKIIFRKDGRQILILKKGDRVYAVNNRCPHQGYPLSEGHMSDDCRLTCNWHNWKFDLESGETVVGGDQLRSYPVRIEGNAILVDLAKPDRQAAQTRALDNLYACFHRYEYDRMGRELVRYKAAGGDYAKAVGEIIRRCHLKFEYGMNHAFAAAADWLELTEKYEQEGRNDAALVTALEAVSHFAWDSQRYDEFPFTEDVKPFDVEAFMAAIEQEEENEAIAMINGAVESGLSYDDLRPVLARAALAHYNDFGHSAIYTHKAGQLLERIGGEFLKPVLQCLVRELIYATREDIIPEFRAYGKNLESWNHEVQHSLSPDDVWGKPVGRALELVSSSGMQVNDLYQLLFSVLVRNFLHFDTALASRTDNKITDNVDWLDFTHGLTFANAIRHLCTESPDLWPRALLQMACFAGRNVSYLDKQLDVDAWTVPDKEEFLTQAHEFLLDHGLPEPIIYCHILKTLMALEEEMQDFPDADWAEGGLAAFNRFLTIPVRRRHSLRTARQSLEFTARE